MNSLQTFSFEEQEVRTRIVEDEIWFVGKDVANILGYTNPAKAIRDHVDEEDKGENETFTPGGTQRMTLINESGLYSLILKSKLPSAKKFKRWVTNEVLPTIRKHGAYMTEQRIEEVLTDPDTIIQLATNLKKEREQRLLAERQVHKMQPKAVFADAVTASHTTILVGDLAKLLKQNGVDIGANRLFEWLRANGYLIRRKGTDYNMPTQYSMELGLFEVKETAITHSDGHISINKTPKVTGKGQQYFINKFLAEQEG